MPTSYLTREGYQKLQDELEFLRTEKREEVAQRLHEAMEGGDFIENAEYEAAKNEQAFVEGRIQELELLLANALVIDEDEENDADGIIQVGATVTIREKGARKKETYTIVGAAEADPRDGKISNESPLGKALLNRRAGEEVEVKTPNGPYTVKILKVE